MAITEQTEAKVADARARARQDKVNPLLISTEDGRLLPNIPHIRKNPKFVIYSGDVKATLEERMLYLRSMGRAPGARRVVNTALDDDSKPFDVGTATKAEIIEFVLIEYGQDLDSKVDIRTLRKQVVDLASMRDASMKKATPVEQLS